MRSVWAINSILLFLLLIVNYKWFIITPKYQLPIISTVNNITITSEQERLVFIGDIHGMYDKFKKIIDKIKPDDYTTLILLGDFISKGPGSGQIINYIINNKKNTKCILGNHEILTLFSLINPISSNIVHSVHLNKEIPTNFSWNPILFSTEEYNPNPLEVKHMHRKLAKKIPWDHWFKLVNQCSGLLNIHLKLTNETLIAVHAGVLPHDLSSPSLKDIFTMRYVDDSNSSYTSKFKFKGAIRWYQLWNKIKTSITVLYGHDAKYGLNLRVHTKGLDTDCVRGGKLSALEYVYDNGQYSIYLHQVEC